MRHSRSFICRLDVQSAADMQKLQDIRKSVAVSNQILGHQKLRVEVRGRKPFVKMPAENSWYKKASGNPVAYNMFGNIVGGLANASALDVYIYNR